MTHVSVQRHMLQMLNYGLLVGAVTWVLLIVSGAQSLKTEASQRVYDITFGPLTLMHMSKQASGDGTTVRFSMELDLIWYIVFWLAVGGLFGLVLVFCARKATKL